MQKKYQIFPWQPIKMVEIWKRGFTPARIPG
jgi:hypothetical protein